MSAAATTSFSAQHQHHLFFIEDFDLPVKSLVEHPLSVRVPKGPSVRGHWLAIQGIQPKIPQNPSIDYLRDKYSDLLSMEQQQQHLQPPQQQPQAGGVPGPAGRRLHIAHRRSPSELTPLMSMFANPGSKS